MFYTAVSLGAVKLSFSLDNKFAVQVIMGIRRLYKNVLFPVRYWIRAMYSQGKDYAPSQVAVKSENKMLQTRTEVKIMRVFYTRSDTKQTYVT